MRSGELRHRIELLASGSVSDGMGGSTSGWSTFATVWAAVEPLRGRAFMEAKAAQSEVSHRVRMRYADGITAAMKVRYEGRIFSIDAVLNINERNRELHLMCVERSDEQA